MLEVITFRDNRLSRRARNDDTLTASHRDPALNNRAVLNIFARCSIVISGVAIVLSPKDVRSYDLKPSA